MNSYKKLKKKYERLIRFINQIESIEEKYEKALPMVSNELHNLSADTRADLWDINESK